MRTRIVGAALAGALLASLAVCGRADSAGERTFGNVWRSFSAETRRGFVLGFDGGWAYAVINFVPEETQQSAEKKRFVLPPGKLVELLDGFYADPANERIAMPIALDIAVARTRGEDVREWLDQARGISR